MGFSLEGNRISVRWPLSHCLAECLSPTTARGFEVSDLRLQGFALRMKWLWLKWNNMNQSQLWADLPDNSEAVVTQMFHYSTSIQLGDGKHTLFGSNRWLHIRSIGEWAPCLVQAVGPRIKKKRTVAEALHNHKWVKDITGALTVQNDHLALSLSELLDIFI